MELDGPGTQEYRPPHLSIGPPLRDEQGDLQFLGGQLLAAVAGTADGLAASTELSAGAFGPGAGVEPIENLGRGPELDPRVAAARRPACRRSRY